MSATSAIGWSLNVMRMSRMSGLRDGPVWKQSFNAGPSSPVDTLYMYIVHCTDTVMGPSFLILIYSFDDSPV